MPSDNRSGLPRRDFLQRASLYALSLGLLPKVVACSSSDDPAAGGGAEPFTFVVISDLHVRLPGNPDSADYDAQKNIDNLTAAIAKINAEAGDAACVVVTGDLVGCLFSEDPADYLTGTENPAEKFKELMSALTIPYYPVLGNHDYQKTYDATIHEGITTDDITRPEAVWKKVLGIDPYYSQVVHGYRFIFLNSNRGAARSAVCATETTEAFCTGSFDDEQLDWLEQQLAEPEPAILFTHHPPFTDNPGKLWAMVTSFNIQTGDRFYEIAAAHADKIKAVFVGHGHLWVNDTLNTTTQVWETCSTGDHNGQPNNIHRVDVGADGTIQVVSLNDAAHYM